MLYQNPNEPHVAGSNVMHQVHEAHKLCLGLAPTDEKILIQLILLALKLRNIILVATESLLYYRPLHIIIANVIMLFTDINCTSLY